MHLVDQIKTKARSSKQTVVLPESYDDRMIEAAGKIVADGLADIVLLGKVDALQT
ncbi:MAG: phosphate acetyltransferase, partial [Geobacteraceae bacterium]|nr:phosphate acetyltransferase [Geobacteraceae bacterium]